VIAFGSVCNLSLVINCTNAINCCILLSFVGVANCSVPTCSLIFACNNQAKVALASLILRNITARKVVDINYYVIL
jgi:hypothetical protein